MKCWVKHQETNKMDAKKVKDIIKKTVAPKSTFGTDPRDPWSAKAGIAESALLDRYLLSRGIQPKFASKDIKVAHSKSNEFKKWARDHMNTEEIQVEDMGHMATKGEGGKTSDRAGEIKKAKDSYKEIKTPRGPGTHNEGYDDNRTGFAKKSREDDEGHPRTKFKAKSLMDRPHTVHVDGKSWKRFPNGHQAHKAVETLTSKGKKAVAIAHFKEETGLCPLCNEDPCSCSHGFVQEARMTAAMKLQRALGREQERSERERRLGAELIKKPTTPQKQDHDPLSQTPKMTQEDVGDAKAAVNADGLPNAQLEPVSEVKKQLSKSARMLKSIFKKDMMKEDMYDHEKEDKSVATYGKKPKMDSADPKDSKGENKPQAAAVLTGGTTLTGQKRDTIEIDPMMRARPGQPDPTKKKEGEKDDKKDDKKKDK